MSAGILSLRFACLLWLVVFLTGSADCVPLEDLLPYGFANTDASIPPGPNSNIPVNIPDWFVFYEQGYKILYISVNGVLSFTSSITAYNPNLFSQDISFIAPFLANANTSVTGTVWFGIETDAESDTAQQVMDEVEMYFQDKLFVPSAIITVTWDEVGYFSTEPSEDQVNTFQCVLATNGTTSFVIFLYPDNGINWFQADDRMGVPAQIGFNKGCSNNMDGGSGDIELESGFGSCDGTQKLLDISLTEDVVNVEEGTNIAGGPPGFYMWMVSSDTIIDGTIVTVPPVPCNNEGLQNITISPSQGHQFGGTPVIISGPCYQSSDDIQCSFGANKMVNGTVIDSTEALCVSPPMDSGIPVPLGLYINGVAIATTAFSIVSYFDGADVTKNDHNLLLSNDDSVTLEWDPAQLFPTTPTNDYLIDVIMYQLNDPQHYDSPAHWTNSSALSLDTLNDGQVSVTVTSPLLQQPSPYALVLFKLVFNPSISSTDKYVNALSSISHDDESPAALWSHVMFLVQNDDSEYCNLWITDNQDSIESSNCAAEGGGSCLPSCPCNIMQAMIPNSGFMSITSTTGLNIVYSYLYSQATDCFASVLRLPGNSDNDPAQICCYNSNGDLLVGMPNGGYNVAISPLAPPTIPWSRHFVSDIAPYIGCCKPQAVSESCFEFYSERPSDSCQNFTSWGPGWSVGDPHLVTLDGYQYTFNGLGEFTLITTNTISTDNWFTVQARMIPLSSTKLGDPPLSISDGTVISSIAISAQTIADVIELRATEAGILVLINGVHTELAVGLTHRFMGYTIIMDNSKDARVLFNNGTVIIDITQSQLQYRYFAGVAVAVSDLFTGKTTGLLGNFNNNEDDDLLPSDSIVPLPPNSELNIIHNEFGLSWKIADKSTSLFTYDQSDSFNTYYYPNFIPAFQTSFTNTSLQLLATTECQDNVQCLYDAAATGDIKVGVATLNEFKNIDMISELSQPIVCDPLCVNGACVDTNQCFCFYGYHGDQCDTPTYQKCEKESNPCLNNGGCSLHLFNNYVCSCPSSYTGQYCETNLTVTVVDPADCGEPLSDPSSSPSLSVSYDATTSGSIASYSCIKGYNLVGERFSTCLNDGSWSSPPPQCVIVDCGIPPTTNSPYLNVAYLSTLYTSVSTYSCDSSKRYILTDGSKTRTCEDTGQWSGKQPDCLIDCGAPLTLGYGVNVTYNNTMEGAEAVYVCDDGDYELNGVETITCLANGTWSYSLTECRVVQYDTLLYIIIGSSIGGSIILFILLVLLVTCMRTILNKCKALKKDEYELSEI